MSLTETPLCDFSWQASPFELPNFDGTKIRLADIQGENGTIIAFICNHCPYVQRIIKDMVEIFKNLQESGIGALAIMPNDINAYPQDAPDRMQEFATKYNFSFPYCYDEGGKIAKIYDAVCTPDFFGFNCENYLHYRGRIYDPQNIPQATNQSELSLAMHQIAKTHQGPSTQFPSMGCSIKW